MSECICNRIGGTKESVMGKPKQWRVTWQFAAQLSTAEVDGWTVEDAISAWLTLNGSRELGVTTIYSVVRL